MKLNKTITEVWQNTNNVEEQQINKLQLNNHKCTRLVQDLSAIL